jgi:hypothetical protein
MIRLKLLLQKQLIIQIVISGKVVFLSFSIN